MSHYSRAIRKILVIYLHLLHNLSIPFVSFLARTRETRTMSIGFMDRAKRDKRFTGTATCVRHFLRLAVPVIISGMPWVILIHAERGVDNLRTMESRLLSVAGKSVTNAITVLQKAALLPEADAARVFLWCSR